MTLYKYVTADRIDILQNGLIRFTQPGCLNDPWELKPYIDKLMTDEGWEKEIRSKAMEEYQRKGFLEEALEKEWKKWNRQQRRAKSLKQFITEAQAIARIAPERLEHRYLSNFNAAIDAVVLRQKELVRTIPEMFGKLVGILSLSEKPDHHLMWSHYANAHTGFVIAFDERHNFFTMRRSEEDEVGGLHQIIYSEKRPHIDAFINFDEEYLTSFANTFFFTKGSQWHYEAEWRVIKPLQEANRIDANPVGNIHLFSLPPSSIEGVIFGFKMSEKEKQLVQELVEHDERYKHLQLSNAVMSESTYDVEIEPV